MLGQARQPGVVQSVPLGSHGSACLRDEREIERLDGHGAQSEPGAEEHTTGTAVRGLGASRLSTNEDMPTTLQEPSKKIPPLSAVRDHRTGCR